MKLITFLLRLAASIAIACGLTACPHSLADFTQTRIISGPSNPTPEGYAFFVFGIEGESVQYPFAGGTFTYRLDAGPETPVGRSLYLSGLLPGLHHLAVTATLSGEADLTPEVWEWLVVENVNAAGGMPDPGFNLEGVPGGLSIQMNGEVQRLAVQPDGKILVAGNFTSVGSTPRPGIARFLPSGALEGTDTFWPGTAGGPGTVRAMAVLDDGDILVAGTFTSWDSEPRSHIARLHSDGQLTSWQASVNGRVDCILVQADRGFIFAGAFTQVSGQPRQGLARLLEDGSLDASFHCDVDGLITSMALHQGGILLCGSFYTVAGQAIHSLALVNNIGAVDTSFHPVIINEGYYNQVCVTPSEAFTNEGGKILVAGTFPSPGGGSYRGLLRLGRDGIEDSAADFHPSGVQEVEDMALQDDGRIIIVGSFATVSGQPRGGIARLRPDGPVESIHEFDTGGGVTGGTGVVRAVALQADGKILLGGNFTHVGGVPSGRFARLQNGGVPSTLSWGSWMLSGTAPDVKSVHFYYNGGSGWQRFGSTIRYHNVWQLYETHDHPASGLLRVTGRTSTKSGNAGLIQQIISLDTPETMWRDQTFGDDAQDPAISGDHADADHDGITNIVEYATGSDPLNPASVPQIYASTGAAGLTLTYNKAAGATDVVVTVQKSDDLTNWTTPGYTEVEVSNNGVVKTMQATVAVDPNARRAFLKATVAPAFNGPNIAVAHPANTTHASGVSVIDFGSALTGQSLTKTFTVKNRGNAPLQVSGISVTGGQATDFAVTPPALPATVITGGHFTFTVVFTPPAVGVRGTTLRVMSNDPDTAVFSLALTGRGALVLAPEIAVEQPVGTNLVDGSATVDLGVVNPGALGPPRTFTIRNTGNVTLNVTGVSATGGQANEFIVSPAPLPLEIDEGTAQSFTVEFMPTAGGPRSTSLRIVSDDADEGTFDITLTGRGNTPPQLHLPASPLFVPATSPAGALVNFTVSATDTENVTAPVPVATPASGTQFALGDTTVNVLATDSGGLTATGSFVVRVAQVPSPHTLAVNGLTVPGAPLPFSYFFDAPSVNTSGICGYTANLEDGNKGLWLGTPGSTGALAVTNQHAPGTANGVIFTDFSVGPRPINALGQSIFSGYVSGGNVDTSNDSGLWMGAPGSLQLLAREGNAAPGTTAGVVFDDFTYYPALALNGSSVCVFPATLIGTGVDSDNNTGIWTGAPGSLALLARTGNPAPGAAGENFTALRYPALSATGQCVFNGTLTSSDTGLWIGTPGSISLVARTNTQAPGVPAGVNFQYLSDRFYISRPVINGQNRIAFAALLDPSLITPETAAGIWTGTAAAPALLARAGNAAPGTPAGTVFADFGTPVINGSGRVAFHANTAPALGDPVSGDGIWRGLPGSLTKVVRTGQAAPGAGAGTTFALINGGTGGFTTENLALNDQNEIVFMAQLDGPAITTENDDSLWHASATGVLTLLAREGATWTPVIGDTRTIALLRFAGSYPGGSGDEDSQPSGLNDAGQITFGLTFTDGSSGLFLVPRP